MFPIELVKEVDSIWPYRIQIQAEGVITMEKEETRRDWETVQEDTNIVTERLKIQNGWLYRVISTSGAVSVTFVPSKE